MAKLATETPRGRGQRHVIKYMLVCQQGQAKWLTGALVALTQILWLCEEAVLQRRKHILNQSIVALRRSVGLFGQFITV